MINLLRFIDLHAYMEQMAQQDPKTLHSTQKVALARWEDMKDPGRSPSRRRRALVAEVRAWLGIYDKLFRQTVQPWEEEFFKRQKQETLDDQ